MRLPGSFDEIRDEASEPGFDTDRVNFAKSWSSRDECDARDILDALTGLTVVSRGGSLVNSASSPCTEAGLRMSSRDTRLDSGAFVADLTSDTIEDPEFCGCNDGIDALEKVRSVGGARFVTCIDCETLALLVSVWM